MKSLIISVCVLSLIGTAIGITIWSATTGTISATVTARNLAITRSSDGAIAYGTLDLSAVTTTDPSRYSSNFPVTQSVVLIFSLFQNLSS